MKPNYRFKLWDRKKLAATALAMWKEQYALDGVKPDTVVGLDKRAIAWSLQSLGRNPDPDEVDLAIGNKTWTQQSCYACDLYPEEWVEIVPETGAAYELTSSYYCKPCLVEALALFSEEEESEAGEG